MLRKAVANRPSAIAAVSVPGSTMAASLPPSSSVRRLRLPAARRMMSCPVRVEPVNTSLAMPGCSAMAWPTSASPTTLLTRPAGSTAAMICTRRSVDSGVNGEGLMTTALPARSAGMMCHTAIISGQFHGVIDPTTPSGLRCSSMRLPSRCSITSTGISSAAAARVQATAPPTSICASARGLPCSRTTRSASSAACCSMAPATRSSAALRSAWLLCCQVAKAWAAASTAWSSWATVAAGLSVKAWPVDGSMTGIGRAAPATFWPPMVRVKSGMVVSCGGGWQRNARQGADAPLPRPVCAGLAEHSPRGGSNQVVAAAAARARSARMPSEKRRSVGVLSPGGTISSMSWKRPRSA